MPPDSRQVLITGGAGYIATHTVIALAEAGYEPVLLDNLSNSKREAVRRVEAIVGRTLPFYEADVRDRAALEAIFAKHPIRAVIHFSGLKSVGESVAEPLRYYDNNVTGSITLCEAMQTAGVRQLVFSSSATVYGDPASVPITEDFPVGATTNPYGRSKFIVERILEDLADTLSPSAPAGGTQSQFPQRGLGGENWRIALLRYFNPVGAHPSGQIGEDPRGIPNNLMPFVAQVAVGKREKLSVYGNDYPTPDGTGVRDYIHVLDLAQGHVAALRYLETNAGIKPINLGTGRGYSVLEMIRAFEKASGRQVPYEVVSRRPGDIASCYADPSRARHLLGWEAKRGIDEMCADTWRWQRNNPNGY